MKDLVDLGLAGLEVIHSDHDADLVEKYAPLADRYGLLKTGGSDFHGTNKKDIQPRDRQRAADSREFWTHFRTTPELRRAG